MTIKLNNVYGNLMQKEGFKLFKENEALIVNGYAVSVDVINYERML